MFLTENDGGGSILRERTECRVQDLRECKMRVSVIEGNLRALLKGAHLRSRKEPTECVVAGKEFKLMKGA